MAARILCQEWNIFKQQLGHILKTHLRSRATMDIMDWNWILSVILDSLSCLAVLCTDVCRLSIKCYCRKQKLPSTSAGSMTLWFAHSGKQQYENKNAWRTLQASLNPLPFAKDLSPFLLGEFSCNCLQFLKANDMLQSSFDKPNNQKQRCNMMQSSR